MTPGPGPDPPPLSEGPLVSVVLLNYNGRRFLPLWTSFLKEGYPRRELIFVDNGSTDGSAEAFERELSRSFPKVAVRFVRLPKNVGYSQGNNAGVREARGEVIAVVNNDIEVSERWIAPVVEAFREDPRLGVAQSRLYSLTDREVPDRVWNRVDPFGFAHPSPDPSGPRREVFYAEGASLFVRRALLDDLGYFYPEEFYMLGEDVDLCWRAHLLGWRVAEIAASVAWHARGGTEEGSVTKRNPRVLRAATRNRLATLYTSYGAPRLLLFLPLSGLLALARALLLWRRGDREHARAVLQGVVGFGRDRAFLRQRRSALQARRRSPDREVLALMMGPFEGLLELRSLWEETGHGRPGAGARRTAQA